MSTLEKKIAKRIGNFYICSKKENTKMNASLPKNVSEQTDKMPPFILFYSEKSIGCASALLGTLITPKLKNCYEKYVRYIDSKCINT